MNPNLDKTPFNFIICLLVSYIVFSPSLFFSSFIFDDHFHVFNNPLVTDPSPFNFLQVWLESRTPIIFNLWQSVSLIFGTDSPVPFRALNIIVHGSNAALVLKISMMLLNKKPLLYARFASWSIAIIFLIHPIQVESVVWISSFKGTAASFMALLSLYYILRVKACEDEEDPFGILILVLFVIGLLIKPTIAPMAIVLPLVDYFHHQTKFKSILKKYSAMIIAAILVGIVFQNHLLTTDYQVITILQKIQITFFSFFVYLKNLIFPFQLAFSYNLTPLEILRLLSITQNSIALIAFYLILVFFFIIAIRKSIHKNLLLLTGISFFLLFLPTSGFIPFDFQNISTVANRYAYLPLIFFLLFIFTLLDELVDFKKLKIGVPVLAFLLLVLNFNQVRLWSNNESILLSGQNPEHLPLSLLLPLTQAKILEKDEEGSRDYAEQAFKISPENSFSLILRRTLLSSDLHQYLKTALTLENNSHYLAKVDPFEIGQLYERLNLFLLADRFYERSLLTTQNSANRQKIEQRLSRTKHIHIMMSYVGMIQYYFDQGEALKGQQLIQEFKALDLPREYHIYIDQLNTWLR